MTKAKSVMSASFHPWAECLGADDSQCWWKCDQGPDTRGLAKAHAEQSPGHNVRVVAEKVDLYRAEAN